VENADGKLFVSKIYVPIIKKIFREGDEYDEYKM